MLRRRLTSLFLALVMLTGLVPAQAFAKETITLPEDELTEELTAGGDFYLASSSASLAEEEDGQYVLRIARGGDATEAAAVRLEMLDITASYGTDYKVLLPGSGLPGARVENAEESRSLMEQIIEEGVEEDLAEDLASAGMSEEQIEAALQEKADAFGAVLSEELSAYAAEHPERYVSEADAADRAALADTQPFAGQEAASPEDGEPAAPAAAETAAEGSGEALTELASDAPAGEEAAPEAVTEEAEAPASETSDAPARAADGAEDTEATVLEEPRTVHIEAFGGESAEADAADTPKRSLSEAFEAQTGRKDDWRALSSDGSSILDSTALLMDYSTDAADTIAEGLNSAYLDIPFAAGETERFVAIETRDNSRGDGDRIFMLRLKALGDSVRVSSEQGKCMVTIVDDEPWEQPTVSFAQETFDAKNGFVDVTIRREGVLSGVSMVHIATRDLSAQSGWDYSQVDADLTFAFGVSERTIHIPVRSSFLSERAEFAIALSDARGCRIGNGEATGVIEKDSESFRMDLVTDEGSNEAEAELQVDTGGIKYGDAVDLSKTSGYSADDDGAVWVDGSTMKIKADSDGWFDGRVWSYAQWDIRRDILRDGNIKALKGYGAEGVEYAGVEVNVSRDDNGLCQSDLKLSFAYDLTKRVWNEKTWDLGNNGASISNQSFRYYTDVSDNMLNQAVAYVTIWNSHDDGHWRPASTLTVNSIKPILRPFVITAEIANPDALRYVDNKGNLVSYKDHDSAKNAGNLTLGGANTGENAVVKFVGDKVEVTCPGNYSYIKKIKIGGYDVTPTYGVGNTVASFYLDTSALYFLYRKDLISFTKNANGSGYVGNIKLSVEMGKIPTPVSLDNSDRRGTVSLGFGLHNGLSNGTWRSGDDRNYNRVYRGDYVRFTEALNSSYANSYSASTIYIKRDRQSNSNIAGQSNDGYEIFDKNQSAWQVTMFNDYSALLARPAFDDINNHVVVRVADSDRQKFDTSQGIFTGKVLPGGSGYTDYEVVAQSDFAAHNYYTLAAVPKSDADVAVWTPGNSSFSYSQNSFFHEASSEQGSNVVTLKCQAADATAYAITGDAYYAGLNLYTGVEGETWLPADGVTVEVSPAAYAISNTEGTFTTIPFRGVNGSRVIMRIEALGTVNYKTVQLSRGIARPVGTSDGSVSAYAVPMGTFIVPMVNPGVPSINAASLSDSEGVGISTAAVWSDAISAQAHRVTFTATVVNDGASYTDTDGKARTEHVKDVKFYAYDAADNTVRGELPGAVTARDNGQGGTTYSLTLGLDMTDENLQRYRPGDKIFARLTTDRVRGNGISVDENGNVLVDEQGRVFEINERGVRVPVLDGDGEQVTNTALLETVYAPVYTGFNLVSAANYIPPELNINVFDGNMDALFEKLPIVGSLNCTLRISKLAVSEQELPNGGISLCVGMRLNMGEERETPEAPADFSGFKEAAKGVTEFGKIISSPPPMTIGFGSAGVNPIVGLYLDFGINSEDSSLGLTFTGGGIYLGCTGFFKVVMYFPVGPIPVYFGVEGDLTGYVNIGMQVADKAMTPAQLATTEMDDLINPDFKFKAQGAIRMYVGVGLCGTLGIRGGLSFNIAYLYYPSVKNIDPNYHEHGFTVSLNLQVWVDAFWFSVPIPAVKLVSEDYGYFKDIKNGGPSASLSSDADAAPVMRRAVQPSEWLPEGAELQSTLEKSGITELIGDNYPYADPQLLDTGYALILVFLTTESFFGTTEKGRGDETTLACSVYPYMAQEDDPHWTKPQRLGDAETMKTGDFQPSISEYTSSGEADIAISWVSRKDEPWAEDPEDPTTEERLKYLSQMEVYTAFYAVDGGETLRLCSCERVTDDDYYNSDPKILYTYGERTDATLFYQASEPSVKDIAANDPVYTDFRNEESRQLLANVAPSQNGGFLMYQEHELETRDWLKATEAGTFIESPVNGQNHPVIADFVAHDFLVYSETTDYFIPWFLYAYTIDGDEDLSTAFDRELYLQLYNADTATLYDPIQLTDDPGISVSRPQFAASGRFNVCLFWHETPDVTQEAYANRAKNGELKMIDIPTLFNGGIDQDTGTLIDQIRIDELRAADPEAYAALSDKSGLADYPYELPIETVAIPESEEFEEGPALGTYLPYMDAGRNLYIIWLQSMTHEVDGETVQTNEIYASGMKRITEDTPPTSISDPFISRSTAWSMPVRLTNDTQFYDEAALVNCRYLDRLFVAANRYAFSLPLDDTSAAKPTESADFVIVEFDPAGSVEATDIAYSQKYPLPGETVEVAVTLRNTGILAAEGGRYEICDLVNGANGDFSLSGEIGALAPGATEEVRFLYTMPSELPDSGYIGFAVTAQENGFDNSNTARFADADALLIGWFPALLDVETRLADDGFYLDFGLGNTGNVVLPAHAVRIIAAASAAAEETWAEFELSEEIPAGETRTYSLKLENVPDDFASGLLRGFVLMRDANGDPMIHVDGTRDIVLSPERPYNLIVNDDAGLKEKGITLKAGESLTLSGSYEGTSLFKDGTLRFATDDSLVAVADGATLFAIEPGETYLTAQVEGLGGSVTIPVTVTEGDSASSGGGGGGGSSETAAAATVNVPQTIANGTVTADRTDAKQGQRVTLTVTPEEGYVLDTLSVTDRNGNAIALTDNGDGTYSFTMPAGRVSVAASFQRAEGASGTGGSAFADVPGGSYFEEAVKWAVENGVTNGTDASHFSPNGSCTRAQMVTFLWRTAGSPEPETADLPFADVVGGSYYEKAVRWAVENGITKGVDETHFAPNATVTRGQTVTFLYRFEGGSASAREVFDDVPADYWCAAPVTWAVDQGITKGVTDKLFAPADPCTRAQIVTFLYRDRAAEQTQ